MVGVGVPLICWLQLKLMPLSQGAFLFNNAFYLVKTNLNQVTLRQSGSQLAWGQHGTGYQLKDDAALALLLEQTAPLLHRPLDCLVLNYSSS